MESLPSISQLKTMNALSEMDQSGVIHILNKLPRDELVRVFDRYPDIKAKYYRYYEEYLTSVDQVDDEAKAMDAKLRARAVIMYQSPEMYNKYADVILIDETLTKVMDLGSFINVGNKVIITTSIVIEWWKIYIRAYDLIDDEENIRPDERMRTAFGDQIRSVSSDGTFKEAMLPYLIEEHSEKSDIALPQDAQEVLFDYALDIKRKMESYSPSGTTTFV